TVRYVVHPARYVTLLEVTHVTAQSPLIRRPWRRYIRGAGRGRHVPAGPPASSERERARNSAGAGGASQRGSRRHVRRRLEPDRAAGVPRRDRPWTRSRLEPPRLVH